MMLRVDRALLFSPCQFVEETWAFRNPTFCVIAVGIFNVSIHTIVMNKRSITVHLISIIDLLLRREVALIIVVNFINISLFSIAVDVVDTVKTFFIIIVI